MTRCACGHQMLASAPRGRVLLFCRHCDRPCIIAACSHCSATHEKVR